MYIRHGALVLAVTAALSAQASAGPTRPDTAVQAFRPASGSGQKPHFKFPAHRRVSADSVLYDQTGVSGIGLLSQNFEANFDGDDSEAADDFVVTDAAGWAVGAFNFQIQVDGDPTSATYDINIYPESGGNLPGGPAACSYSNLPGVLDAGFTTLGVSLPSMCTLPQGTYWLSVVANLGFAGVNRFYWALDVDSGSHGALPAWRNPLDGTGVGCTSWANIAACGLGGPP